MPRARASFHAQFMMTQSMMVTSSTSKMRFAFGGITGGFPAFPYACTAGMVSTACSPDDIVSSAASQPA